MRTRARTTIRTLEDKFGDPGWIATVRPGAPPVAAELFFDPPGHVRLPSADAEIVDRACEVRDLYGGPVTVVARDTGMGSGHGTRAWKRFVCPIRRSSAERRPALCRPRPLPFRPCQPPTRAQPTCGPS